MACLICGNQDFNLVFATIEPDKYESYQGINHIRREWRRCVGCGFNYQWRNYPLEKLEKIYKEGYRNPLFRGETIGEAFNRIKVHSTENNRRVKFLEYATEFDGKTVLDIGSGLGIFPYSIRHRCGVECVETNVLSIDFIESKLGIRCYSTIPKKKYDLVTVIHVLEHITEPDEFLQNIKTVTDRIFIEVPDSVAFKFLPQDHDDFNSCHLWSFDIQNIIKLIERNGFEITDRRCPHYPERDLDRIWIVAQCG